MASRGANLIPLGWKKPFARQRPSFSLTHTQFEIYLENAVKQNGGENGN